MKTIIKLSLMATLCCLFVTSCSKDEVIEPESNSEEGLMGTAGDQERPDIVTDAIEVQSEVLFHKSYSCDLSAKQADILWSQEMENFEVPSLKNGSTPKTEWFHRVLTITGSQKNAGTDGYVQVRIDYRTSVGDAYTIAKLDKKKHDDRERGDWDYYLIRSYIEGVPVIWVEESRAIIYLKGTDGWFVSHFDIHLRGRWQNVPTTGQSNIYSYPFMWLDSSRSNNWAAYNTGDIGTGRLNFY